MFHAAIMLIATCFGCTLYYFYAFSGTNLLTRCHSASSCLLCLFIVERPKNQNSRNWTGASASFSFLEALAAKLRLHRHGGLVSPGEIPSSGFFPGGRWRRIRRILLEGIVLESPLSAAGMCFSCRQDGGCRGSGPEWMMLCVEAAASGMA